MSTEVLIIVIVVTIVIMVIGYFVRFHGKKNRQTVQ
jgi:nitrogen fixation-related uncharacterized protein